MERIGIYGGSFDPPHLGHLAVAQAALYELELDKVVFVPCGNPPHKDGGEMTAPAVRFAMTQTAIRSNPRFEISDSELNSAEPSYTANTLAQWKRREPDAQLFLIVGADSLAYMKKWWRPDEIFRLCEVAVVARPDTAEEELNRAVAECTELFGARIRRVPMPLIGISSSEIRACGDPEKFRYLLERDTLDYIKKHKLYGGT